MKEHSAKNRHHRQRGPGGPMAAGTMPAEKAKNFGQTARRLLGYLKPYKARVTLVFVLAIIGVVAAIVAPKVLGKITNVIFAGVQGRLTDSNFPFDFEAIVRWMLVLGVIYLINSIFTFLQYKLMVTVSQKTVYEMRRSVDQKLRRLPLKYYDDNPRGEILSRVTNDVDNIASTLQETLNQMISSVVTVIGVIITMCTISFLLTGITILTLIVCLIVTMMIAKHSQRHFSKQWSSTGRLNGHIEEMYTGHNVVKLFNKQQEEIDKFNSENEILQGASF